MARPRKTMNDIPTNFEIASSEKEVARLPKNVAVSDFESMRKEHIHKQINFLMMKVTNELETKFDIIVQEHNY